MGFAVVGDLKEKLERLLATKAAKEILEEEEHAAAEHEIQREADILAARQEAIEEIQAVEREWEPTTGPAHREAEAAAARLADARLKLKPLERAAAAAEGKRYSVCRALKARLSAAKAVLRAHPAPEIGDYIRWLGDERHRLGQVSLPDDQALGDRGDRLTAIRLELDRLLRAPVVDSIYTLIGEELTAEIERRKRGLPAFNVGSRTERATRSIYVPNRHGKIEISGYRQWEDGLWGPWTWQTIEERLEELDRAAGGGGHNTIL